MNTREPGGGREALSALGLVLLVAACGFAGMALGKGLHPTIAVPAPRVEEARSLRTAAAPRPGGNVSAVPGAALAPVRPEQARAARPDAVTESGAGAEPGPAIEAAPTESTPGSGEVAAEDREVQAALERWRGALLTNDAAAIAPFYSAQVNRYFLKIHVSRAFVRDTLEREEERGTRLTKYTLEGISIDHVKADEVEVHFRAEFQVSTPIADRTGDTRTLLILRRDAGEWRIVYERDFKS